MDQEKFNHLKSLEARKAQLLLLKAHVIELMAGCMFHVKMQIGILGTQSQSYHKQIQPALIDSGPENNYDDAQYIVTAIDKRIESLEKEFNEA